MDRGDRIISGWPAIVLAILLTPILIPVALVVFLLTKAGLLKPKLSDLTANEVARYIRDFIEGTGRGWDWDDFENMTLKDPALEAIRDEACRAGPPNSDLAKLKEMLARAEALRA